MLKKKMKTIKKTPQIKIFHMFQKLVIEFSQKIFPA